MNEVGFYFWSGVALIAYNFGGPVAAGAAFIFAAIIGAYARA